MPFKKGNKLSPGGKKGNKGGGRPDWFKAWCGEAIYKESRLKRLEKILDEGSHKEFLEVLKFCRETNAGKPAQQMNHEFSNAKRMVWLFDGNDKKG